MAFGAKILTLSKSCRSATLQNQLMDMLRKVKEVSHLWYVF